MPHHQFLPFADSDSSLDLATAALLDAAYDRALAELHDRGPDSVRQAIARRIVTLAAAGERAILIGCVTRRSSRLAFCLNNELAVVAARSLSIELCSVRRGAVRYLRGASGAIKP
jgi:hypothetical protein